MSSAVAASGQPMQLPVVDIVEVGAGGGSIAWLDSDGGIHVGPQSAGADPGPACYGKGNPNPVVTDANLVLGRINPKRFLNGNMLLDVAAAERAIKEKIADPLGLERTRCRTRHCPNRRFRDVARGARRFRQQGRRSARHRHHRVRRRRPASRRRHCARDFRAKGHRPEAPRHVLRARNADGVLAPGFRAHADRQARHAQYQRGHGRVRRSEPSGRGSDRARKYSKNGCRPSPSTPISVMSDRNTPFRSQSPVPICCTGDLGPLRKMFHAEHAKRYSQSAPDESMEIVSLRLVVTAPRQDRLAERWLSEPWQAEGTMQETMRDVVFDDPQHPLQSTDSVAAVASFRHHGRRTGSDRGAERDHSCPSRRCCVGE